MLLTLAMLFPLAADQQQANPLVTLFPFILIGLALYFVMIRPQRKRAQQQQQLLSLLEVGDDILTIGGIYGTIRHLDEEAGEVTVEIAPGTTIRILRSAVSRKVGEPEETAWDEDEDEDVSDDDAEQNDEQ